MKLFYKLTNSDVYRGLKLEGRNYYLLVLLVIIHSFAQTVVWKQFGGTQRIQASNLWSSNGLVLFNLILSIWLLTRERFASYILLWASIVWQVYIIIFLYVILVQYDH